MTLLRIMLHTKPHSNYLEFLHATLDMFDVLRSIQVADDLYLAYKGQRKLHLK